MNTHLQARVVGLGLCAPGLPDRDAFATWLRDNGCTLPPGREAQPIAARMAPAERRRAPRSIRLALEAATQALGARDPAPVGMVYCSAYGDMSNTGIILDTLAQTPTAVSPTRFTHSVHNAAPGHWSMAAGSHAPTSALACGRDGFGSALLTALLEVHARALPQLLVCCDAADAGALADAAPCAMDFAGALLLAPATESGCMALLRARVLPGAAMPTPPRDTRLHPWWSGNPAAAALPLIEACLAARAQDFTWPLGSGTLLTLDCEPAR